MKRHTINLTIFTTFFLVLAISLVGCGKKTDKTGLTSSHTTVSQETLSPTAPSPEASKASTAPKESETGSSQSLSGNAGSGETKKDQGAPNVSAFIKTEVSGNVSIQYPVLSNLNASGKDSSILQAQINKLLHDYAVQVIKAYGVDEAKDTLAIKCKVVSADRKRITAVYTGTYTMLGSAHPSNIFYTNTINTVTGQVMGLTDYADSYTLAGYVLSNDCQFLNANSDLTKQLMNVKNDLDIQAYTDMFNYADFPYKAPKDSDEEPNNANFPQVFSFESQGTIYVSIPVSHALGDYALVAYTPESK